jgi:hypothetical protein
MRKIFSVAATAVMFAGIAVAVAAPGSAACEIDPTTGQCYPPGYTGPVNQNPQPPSNRLPADSCMFCPGDDGASAGM